MLFSVIFLTTVILLRSEASSYIIKSFLLEKFSLVNFNLGYKMNFSLEMFREKVRKNTGSRLYT